MGEIDRALLLAEKGILKKGYTMLKEIFGFFLFIVGIIPFFFI